jgi:hypothetical protein
MTLGVEKLQKSIVKAGATKVPEKVSRTKGRRDVRSLQHDLRISPTFRAPANADRM